MDDARARHPAIHDGLQSRFRTDVRHFENAASQLIAVVKGQSPQFCKAPSVICKKTLGLIDYTLGE